VWRVMHRQQGHLLAQPLVFRIGPLGRRPISIPIRGVLVHGITTRRWRQLLSGVSIRRTIVTCVSISATIVVPFVRLFHVASPG
jgi:hypothetical protein